ncbi:hypothetical protein PWP93_27065 [Paraburkholderia sp. A1RI-2L]|uniref:hypothetical protein n=1 Tax=Paraburkholderia sp. A1RI-2L TaxID=3028367 RepID=UPI003B7D0871
MERWSTTALFRRACRRPSAAVKHGGKLGWAKSNLWQTAPPGQNARRGKKLRVQGHVRKKAVAKPCCIRRKPVSTTAGVSGCTDLYNRQLHPEERTLAKQLADKSGGQYTQAQIEDQMRIMGVSVNGGSVPSGVAEELNGRTPTDPGAQWINTGLTNANGNPLVIQSLPQTNQALQTFIMENYNSASPGAVPSGYVYQPTPIPADVRGTVANVAGGVSTAAGRFGAITAAGASIPSPYAPGLATAAYIATATGMAADAVVQIAKPDVGQYAVSGGIGIAADVASRKIPGLTPAINETANALNNTELSNSAKDFINKFFNKFNK